jgi:hypothetical protein
LYSSAIGRWSQVVDSFDLFVEGFCPILSDPVPKMFKLSSCKGAFSCIDVEIKLILEAAQHFAEVCLLKSPVEIIKRSTM